MSKYLRGGAGEGPSGLAGRPSSLAIAPSAFPAADVPRLAWGRAAGRVQELRLQPTAVPGAPTRRPRSASATSWCACPDRWCACPRSSGRSGAPPTWRPARHWPRSRSSSTRPPSRPPSRSCGRAKASSVTGDGTGARRPDLGGVRDWDRGPHRTWYCETLPEKYRSQPRRAAPSWRPPYGDSNL